MSGRCLTARNNTFYRALLAYVTRVMRDFRGQKLTFAGRTGSRPGQKHPPKQLDGPEQL